MSLFETERMIVRKLEETDVPALLQILSDPEVMKYSIRGICDKDATTQFIKWSRECYITHEVGPWALIMKDSNILIGFCGVSPEEVEGQYEINLGYRLSRYYWNKGLATEATKAVVSYAFNEKGVKSIMAIVEPDNIASIRVVEKSGFNSYRIASFHNRMVNIYQMNEDYWRKEINGDG